MSKRLIEAAEAVLRDNKVIHHQRTELKAALEAARQPVTVTPEQAIYLCDSPRHQFGDEVGRGNISAEDAAQLQKLFTGILEKARELGL